MTARATPARRPPVTPAGQVRATPVPQVRARPVRQVRATPVRQVRATPVRQVIVRPATPARWADVEALFGEQGACEGCWCQFWKLEQARYRAGRGAPNRRAFRSQVEAGEVPGLLAYAGREAVGWVAVAPRAAYPRLARHRTLAAVDQVPAWSVPCFFVKRGWRGLGVAGALLAAAAERACRAGATVLEGYPMDSRATLADAWLYTGALSTFARAGFVEVARRARTRPVVRLALGGGAVRPARRRTAPDRPSSRRTPRRAGRRARSGSS